MSELRQDPVSGEWIIVAPGRASRPHDFKSKGEIVRAPIETCPFEDLEKSGNSPLVLVPGVDWRVAVIPNKYPVLEYDEKCPFPATQGPYKVMEGKGHHEVVITRNHDNDFPKLSSEQALEVLKVFQSRFNEISKDECVNYISLFHAWGPSAAASIYHPHYQILALPIVPPDIQRSLEGSLKYFEETGKCVHCSLLEFDIKEGKRIIYENDKAIAVAPYVSRDPFEVRIFPKEHSAHFSDSSDELLQGIADVTQNILRKMESNLGDPDYNFFIHTPSLKDKEKSSHYHWHLEILPKTSIWGGFEWSTGVTVNIIDPEETTKMLK